MVQSDVQVRAPLGGGVGQPGRRELPTQVAEEAVNANIEKRTGRYS